jgi:radical SAM protein with 4Fe4S-binding SPASM domain
MQAGLSLAGRIVGKVMCTLLPWSVRCAIRVGVVQRVNRGVYNAVAWTIAMQFIGWSRFVRFMGIARKHYSLRSLRSYAPVPHHIQIGLVSFCNLRCPFCPLTQHTAIDQRNHNHRTPLKMSDETLRRSLEGAVAVGCERVEFTFFGEALLHERVFDYIRAAKTRGLHVRIHTNGNCLTPETIDQLLDTQVDEVCFSIDAVEPSLYTVLRKGGDIARVRLAVQQMRKNIDARRLKTQISVQCIAQPENPEEWKAVVAEFRHDVDLWIIDSLHVMESCDPDLKYRFKACEIPWTLAAIYPDGDVSLCCGDETKKMVVGNINVQCFEDIWHGKTAQQMRLRLLSRTQEDVPQLCSTCQSYDNKPDAETVDAVQKGRKA